MLLDLLYTIENPLPNPRTANGFYYLSNTEKTNGLYECSSVKKFHNSIFCSAWPADTRNRYPNLNGGDFHTQASYCWGFSGKERPSQWCGECPSSLGSQLSSGQITIPMNLRCFPLDTRVPVYKTCKKLQWWSLMCLLSLCTPWGCRTLPSLRTQEHSWHMMLHWPSDLNSKTGHPARDTKVLQGSPGVPGQCPPLR